MAVSMFTKIIIVIVICLILLFVWTGTAYGTMRLLFFSKPSCETSVGIFRNVASTVDEVLLNPENVQREYITLENGCDLVGFSKGVGVVAPPESCYDKTCLCLCRNRDCINPVGSCKEFNIEFIKGDSNIGVDNLFIRGGTEFMKLKISAEGGGVRISEGGSYDSIKVGSKDSEGIEQYDDQIKAAINSNSEVYVSENLVKGLINQESSGEYDVVSSCGAVGLMQLMPCTARERGVGDLYGLDKSYKDSKYIDCAKIANGDEPNCNEEYAKDLIKERDEILKGIKDPKIELVKLDGRFDPETNINAGVAYLASLLKKYKGDEALALAAYNAGPTTVDKKCGSTFESCSGLSSETEDYVPKVLAYKKYFDEVALA